MFRRPWIVTLCSLLVMGLFTGSAPALADNSDASPAEEEGTADTELEVLAANETVDGITIEINALERAASGETSLLWTFHNLTDERIHTTAFRVPKYLNYYSSSSTHGVTLLDESSQTRYYPLVDSDQRCLCVGGFPGPGYTTFVDPDRKSTYWNTYLLPEDVTTVTVEFPDFEPIEDVPIS